MRQERGRGTGLAPAPAVAAAASTQTCQAAPPVRSNVSRQQILAVGHVEECWVRGKTLDFTQRAPPSPTPTR